MIEDFLANVGAQKVFRVGRDGLREVDQAFAGENLRDIRQGPRSGGGERIEDVADHFLTSHIVEFGELRGDAGLYWELPEKCCAERVNRLNFEAAWCFDGAGEERSGAVQIVGHVFAKLGKPGLQGVVVEH